MIAKIPLDQIAKVKPYVNTKRKSMSQIQAEIGCDYIINGGLFDMKTFKPMNHLVVDGVILSKSLGKTGASIKNTADGVQIELSYDNQIGWDDHVSGYPALIANGKILKFSIPKGLDGKRPRSLIGKTKDCFILATFEGCTLQEAAKKMLAVGCIWAINLDGGGSVQAIFDGAKETSSRIVHNFICVWLKSEDKSEDKSEENGENLMTIVQDLIPKGRKNRPGRANPMKYITVHETDNTNYRANARSHGSYLKTDEAVKKQVSWHYTVDDTCAVQHIPDNEDAWHASDGAGDGNRKSIGVEICVNSDGDFAKAVQNTAELVAMLCKKHDIPIENVVQHYRWSKKNCPKKLRAGKTISWNDFLGKVENILSPKTVVSTKTDAPSDWAKGDWEWMKEFGIMDGTRPLDSITRQEVAVVCARVIRLLKG